MMCPTNTHLSLLLIVTFAGESVGTPCNLCMDGSWVPNPSQPIGEDDRTCQDVMWEVMRLYDSSDPVCRSKQLTDGYQCGCPDDVCTLCPDRTSLPQPYGSYSDQVTCGDVESFVGLFNKADDDECLKYQLTAGVYCNCPAPPPETPSSVCRLCGDGELLPEHDRHIVADGPFSGLTCAEIERLGPEGAGADECTTARGNYEDAGIVDLCCDEEGSSRCRLCLDGTDIPNPTKPYTKVGNQFIPVTVVQTCGDIADIVSHLQADNPVCKGYQLVAGVYCGCPYDVKEEDPVDVCRLCGNRTLLPTYDQLTVEGTTVCAELERGVNSIPLQEQDEFVCEEFLQDPRLTHYVEECCSDPVHPSLSWNDREGGLDLEYVIKGDGKDLGFDVIIEVFWASEETYDGRIRTSPVIFTHTVKAGSPVGPGPVVRIPGGDSLANAPVRTTHIVASTGPENVGFVEDVEVLFGGRAVRSVVSVAMLDIIKGGLRAAGQKSATITSTIRTPEDQARVMFQNLVNGENTIQENIAKQKSLYKKPGQAVIDAFATATSGMTREEILENKILIREAMLEEIHNQGPVNVSRHCGDPAKRVVVDVYALTFNNHNGPIFVEFVQEPRTSKFIDERKVNKCYHLELEH